MVHVKRRMKRSDALSCECDSLRFRRTKGNQPFGCPKCNFSRSSSILLPWTTSKITHIIAHGLISSKHTSKNKKIDKVKRSPMGNIATLIMIGSDSEASSDYADCPQVM